MGLGSHRSFLKSRLVNLGFTEHTDAFDDANRPQQKLDKLFRIQSNPIVGNGASHSSHRFDFDVNLIVTLKGKLDNREAVDRAYVIADDILADILQESVRYGTDIKVIRPGSVTIERYSLSDENDILLTINLTGYQISNY